MICIPKLALEIQDLSLPATVLLPRLDDIVPMMVFGGTERSYVQRIVMTFSFFVLKSYVQRTLYNLLLLLTPTYEGIIFQN